MSTTEQIGIPQMQQELFIEKLQERFFCVSDSLGISQNKAVSARDIPRIYNELHCELSSLCTQYNQTANVVLLFNKHGAMRVAVYDPTSARQVSAFKLQYMADIVNGFYEWLPTQN